MDSGFMPIHKGLLYSQGYKNNLCMVSFITIVILLIIFKILFHLNFFSALYCI